MKLNAFPKISGITARLITFGGDTSDTGGFLLLGRKKYWVTLDISKMRVFALERESMVLEARVGLKVSEIENELNRHRLTLGHFTESFEFSTLNGWIVTNAAGQKSNRYGKIGNMLIGIKMVTHSGTCVDRNVPAESAFFT